MLRYAFSLFVLSSLALCADVVDAENESEPLIAADQSADQYDKPYSLNPVPINPRAQEPTNWREAYKSLCDSMKQLDAKVDLLEKKVELLEKITSTPPSSDNE